MIELTDVQQLRHTCVRSAIDTYVPFNNMGQCTQPGGYNKVYIASCEEIVDKTCNKEFCV